MGDETRLRQVLINLVCNAVKFTSEGSVTLGVEPEAGGIHFSVSDTGIGIAPEEMAGLFRPFSQTESGRRLHKGTGLGLALSQQLVLLMGGTLAVSSQLGKGSCFSFTIPLRQIEVESEIVECTEPHCAGLDMGTQMSTAGLIEQFATRTPEWVDELKAAVDIGDFVRISALLETIRDDHAALYRILSTWCYNFDQEAFADLLGRTAGRRPSSSAGPR
jgi:hypothetical protein